MLKPKRYEGHFAVVYALLCVLVFSIAAVRDEDLNRIERLEQRIEELTNPKLSEDKIDVASGGSNFWEPKLYSRKKDWTSGGSKKQEISDPYAPNKRKVLTVCQQLSDAISMGNAWLVDNEDADRAARYRLKKELKKLEIYMVKRCNLSGQVLEY